MISQREAVQKLKDQIEELALAYEFLNKRLEPMERDAIRYQKFRKAYLDGKYPDKFTWLETPEEFDAAVDALPEPDQTA